ncbi:MAG: hypothetical protein ACI86H_001673 [bacterium]|jgi:hypothetical protein
MKKLILIFCLLALFPLQNTIAGGNQLGVWDASKPSTFKIPKKFSPLLKNYRKNWIRLTGLEKSGLHWNQGVVIYINKNYKTFVNNYIGYLKSLEGLDDEECEEDDEEECDSPFLMYAKGTVILKENYLLNKGVPVKALTATVMIKHKKSYDLKLGGWQFLQFDQKGTILVNGKSTNTTVAKACSDCHKNMNSRDYVFSTFYKPKKTKKTK